MEVANAVPAIIGDAGAESAFEPVRLLAELVDAAKGEQRHTQPDRLAMSEITRMPDLFQPRGMSEKHIGDLVRAIKIAGELDPLTVLAIGQRAILVDGHHRIEAYDRAGILADIPVKYFPGTPQEAVLEAGMANSKAKLPMSGQERQDYAWRLVLLGKHSKAEIATASGASTSQVANMRTVKRKLGQSAFGYQSWWRARLDAQGGADELSEDDREEWKREMAGNFADRLAKEFSTKLAEKPEIAAMAFDTYFGRRLPELVQVLRAYVAEDELGPSDEF